MKTAKLTIRQRHGITSIFALMDGSTCLGMSRNDWVTTAAEQLRVARSSVNKFVRRLEQSKMFRDWLVSCGIKREVTPQGVTYSL